MGILAAAEAGGGGGGGAAAPAPAPAAMFGDDGGERAKNDDDDEHEYDLVMPGFRFHPTEEELIEFYLRRKVEGRRFNVELIAFLDLYRYDPWELPAMATIGEKEWYFYVPRDRKYRNGDRPNRVTTSGYWKATGADRVIRSENQLRSIGLKKTLVFYSGKAPKGIRTSWIMNEYRLPHSETVQYQIRTEISLCRVHKRSGVEDNSQIAGNLLASSCRPSSSSRATADHKRHSSFASSSSSSHRQTSSTMEMIMKFPKLSSAAINGSALSIYGGGSSAASIASLSSTTSMEEDSHGHLMKNSSMNHLNTAAAAASAITDYYSTAAAAAPAAAPGIEELVNFNMNQIAPPLNQHTMSLPMISEKLWEWWNPLPEVGN